MINKISNFFSNLEGNADDFIEHTIVRGDNPWKLSMKYFGNPSMVDEIMELNDVKDATKIQIGEVFKIPRKKNHNESNNKVELKNENTKKPENIVFESRDLKNSANKIAESVGIPSDLFLGLISTESSWNPSAKSSVGAMGLTQLMPGTAAEMGVKDPTDPMQNMIGGAKYLKRMLNIFSQYENKEQLALMAYHAGPGNVKKWIKAGSPTDGFSGVGKYTLDYPKKVFKAAGR